MNVPVRDAASSIMADGEEIPMVKIRVPNEHTRTGLDGEKESTEVNQDRPLKDVVNITLQDQEPEEDGESELDDSSPQATLIHDANVEIDEDGVVQEYEVALKYIGFGLFHLMLIAFNGLAVSSDAIEVLSVSYVLPIIREKDQFDLEDWQNAFLSSIIFVGMLLGGYVWGALSDLTGRRHTILFSLTVNGVFGFASGLAPNYWSFVIFRFISGIGVGGSIPVIVSYMSEFVCNKYRGPYLGIQSTFWTIGTLMCGAFAWIIIPQESIHSGFGDITITSWRVFIMVSAVPAFLGVILYSFLPESPRFLLEVGKVPKAMKALELAYRLNHLHKDHPPFPVKMVIIKNRSSGVWKGLFRGQGRFLDRLMGLLSNIKEIVRRSAVLFQFKLLRRTVLLLIIMFSLAFGSYGVTLWYPSYVKLITDAQKEDDFNHICHRNITNSNVSVSTLNQLCDCSETVFDGTTIGEYNVKEWVISASFVNSTFYHTYFVNVLFVNCEFVNSEMIGVTFNSAHFINSNMTGIYWNNVTLQSVGFSSTSEVNQLKLINVSVDGVLVANTTMFVNLLYNSSSDYHSSEVEQLKDEENVHCEDGSDDHTYRDNFIIAASALPGNIVSSIAVYFLRRNYWMAFSLLTSTVCAFFLYIFHTEAAVVVVLSIFTALSTPAWNDSSLLIVELYPTHLRSTALGVLLIMARIGAISGTNIFGEFVYINPNIPILMVVAVLGVGGVVAIFLPKTTRKTILQ